MAYSQKLKTRKIKYKDYTLVAGTTPEIDLEGGTLVGVTIPEMTSTSFTITASPVSGGTFRTVRDDLGIYAAAGTDITFTIGSTSVGFYPIPPALTVGLEFVKLVFSSSETPTITVASRNFD